MNPWGRLSNDLEAQVGAHQARFLIHSFGYRASGDTAPKWHILLPDTAVQALLSNWEIQQDIPKSRGHSENATSDILTSFVTRFKACDSDILRSKNIPYK